MSQAASSPFAEVRLLGPVELGRRDGSSAAVGSGLERTLLAALAVNAGLVVSTGDLIDGLWESGPPPTARHALQVHVSSLRHRLGVSPSPLEARPSGYVLKLDPGQLDTERFESLAATGRAELASNQPARAADVLEAALAVWRGPALADVSGDRLTGTEMARLSEARRATEEDRLDAELAAGRSDRAAAMAEALAAAEPFRERRWGQLMLALYRSGRQAEALRRFILVGDLLRDELGVDPSPALRDLHRRMLTHAPDLELAGLPASPGGPAGDDPPVTRFTRRGGSALAYQVLGDGPIDLVFLPGFTGHLEIRWEDPTLSRLFRRLAASSRLVLLDKRGTGMSDRAGGFPPLPEHVDDLLAVMDAVGSRRAALFGVLDGGAIALLCAVAHPDRVAGVATYATAPVLSASDYPPGATPDQLATLQTLLSRLLDVDEVLPLWAPSRVGDAAFSRWLTRYMRMGAGVGGAVEIVQRMLETDLRAVLPEVAVPTLVLHRRGDRAISAGNASYLADHIPGARLVLLPGDDTVLWAGDVDAIAAAIEPWLGGLSGAPRTRKPARPFADPASGSGGLSTDWREPLLPAPAACQVRPASPAAPRRDLPCHPTTSGCSPASTPWSSWPPTATGSPCSPAAAWPPPSPGWPPAPPGSRGQGPAPPRLRHGPARRGRAAAGGRRGGRPAAGPRRPPGGDQPAPRLGPDRPGPAGRPRLRRLVPPGALAGVPPRRPRGRGPGRRTPVGPASPARAPRRRRGRPPGPGRDRRQRPGARPGGLAPPGHRRRLPRPPGRPRRRRHPPPAPPPGASLRLGPRASTVIGSALVAAGEEVSLASTPAN